MPYLTSKVKQQLDEGVKPSTPGELNYLFTKQAIAYVEANGLDYQAINDVLGALAGCSAEFYRRVAAPYEDRKILMNGDVYD